MFVFVHCVHLQPSGSLGPSKRNRVNAELVAQSITDYRGHA